MRRSSSSRTFAPKTPPGLTWRVVSMTWACGFPGRSRWTAPVTATPYRARIAPIKSSVRRTCSSSGISLGRAMFMALAVLELCLFSAPSAAVHSAAVSIWLPSASQLPRSSICAALAADAWLPYALSSRESYIVRQEIYAARWMADCPTPRETMDMDR